MLYVLILMTGAYGSSGSTMATVPGFAERSQCESAGEAWKLETKKTEYYPRYYCIPGPSKLMSLR